MLEKFRRYLREMIPVLLVGVALIIFIFFSALEYSRLEENLGRFDGGWLVNNEAVNELPMREYKDAGEQSVLSIELGEEFALPKTICFYTVYEDVEVHLDGQLLYHLCGKDMDKTINAAPSMWNVVQLEGGDSGKTLEIRLSTPYENFGNIIPEFRFGDHAQVSRYINMNTMPHFIAALAILCIGLIFAIISMTLRFHTSSLMGIYSLSLFIVAMAIFLMARQTNILTNIYSGAPYVLIENIAFLLCPLIYTRYLMRSSQGMHRRISITLHIASIINGVLVLLLQLLNVRDMPQVVSSTRYLCVAVAAYVLILELRGRGRVWYCLAALATIGVFLYYYITENISWVVYAGIFAYLYVIFYRVIAAIVRSEAEEIRLGAALEVSKSEIATIQITSHFFYHTLDSIRALIRLDADKAYKMTGDFAKYIRYRVDGVERMEETVSFAKELRSIRAYTDIKQAQLGERFSMIFDVETEDFVILPLTVQPLVENAVIHAVQKRRDGGVVQLVCRENEKDYSIQVIDNGPGAAAAENPSERRESVAVRNVNTRLNFYGIDSLVFEKNELGGMTVSLRYPKHIDKKG